MVYNDWDGVLCWPAETTGDLVIQRPDGTVIRTEMGDGEQQLRRERRCWRSTAAWLPNSSVEIRA